MFNTEDDIIPKLKASCTKEEAVAKMLGWLQGPIRRRVIQVTEQGISADLMPHLSQLESSLEEQLLELRNAARTGFFKALEEDALIDIIEEKENVVIECDNQIKLAATYLESISDEVAKGNASTLRIDREATSKSGITHITLKSLKIWALKEFGISLDPFSAQKTAIYAPQQQQELPAEEIQQIDDQSNQREDWPSPIKAKTFKITTAFLIDAFAKTSKDFLKKDNTPNINAIAKHLENLAKEANDDNPVLGQSSETIRRSLAESIGTRKLTLHEKKQ
ncbi:hypothetical protein [Nitrosomonas ureae]|uniref:Uncharacterized protein n=1 Tax=Nitrosomonas ureae TaxID=44577 RepID=A0A2T5I629_9PROT|nr:hypothetical protein [Nitrosomonas ureae]PTQ79283.1 hypothetical protein C8R28_105315 [Nitrosomonas ureae]